MDWYERCCVARARVLALHAQVLCGGKPRTDQLRRAILPVLGDLIPLPGPEVEDEVAATVAAEASDDWLREAHFRRLAAATEARVVRGPTVDAKDASARCTCCD